MTAHCPLAIRLVGCSLDRIPTTGTDFHCNPDRFALESVGIDLERRSCFVHKKKNNSKSQRNMTKIKPRPAPPNVLDPSLYLRIKKEIHEKLARRALLEGHPVRWGAYHSTLLSRMYKSAGGRYAQSATKELTGIRRWHAERWIDICRSHPPHILIPCGRSGNHKDPYPVCRPYKRISSKTPLTYDEMDKSLIKSLCRSKAQNPSRILRIKK